MNNVTKTECKDDIEYAFYTPAGEEFVFSVPKDKQDQAQAVFEYAEEFDPDNHVEMWLPHRGENGVPNALRELLDDAEWIKSKLYEIAKELKGE